MSSWNWSSASPVEVDPVGREMITRVFGIERVQEGVSAVYRPLFVPRNRLPSRDLGTRQSHSRKKHRRTSYVPSAQARTAERREVSREPSEYGSSMISNLVTRQSVFAAEGVVQAEEVVHDRQDPFIPAEAVRPPEECICVGTKTSVERVGFEPGALRYLTHLIDRYAAWLVRGEVSARARHRLGMPTTLNQGFFDRRHAARASDPAPELVVHCI